MPTPPDLLTTALPGCILRPWRDGDQPALVRHGDDRAVWRNLTDLFPHPYTAADADFWITLCQDPGRSVHRAIVLDGEVVGGIGAISGTDVASATAQFGYWLGRAVWGRGLASAAAAAFAPALLDGPFARLEARVFAWNPSSMRVLEKACFTREAWLRDSVTKDGALIDSALYARLARAAHHASNPPR